MADTSERPLPGWVGVWDRALGAYLGLALGDALGATVAYLRPQEIQARFGVHRHIVGGGWLKLAPGQVTDDTGLSLALGQALLRAGPGPLAALGAGGRSPGGPVGAPHPRAVLPLGLPGEGAEAPADETLGRAVGDGLAAWLRSKPVDCGNTSRRGILRYLHEGSWAGPANEGDAGNGALKRNLPSVLATLWHPAAFEPLSLLQARLTHHHPLSDAATVGVGDMARQLILGEAAQEVACWADDWVASYPVFRHVPYPGRASGYVVDTVQTVLHHFVAEPDFEAAVVATVNRGGDADTTGALVGLLAGARCGASGLPRPWLRRLPSATVAAITEQTGALLSLAAASAPRGAGPAPDAGGAWRWPPPAPGA